MSAVSLPQFRPLLVLLGLLASALLGSAAENVESSLALKRAVGLTHARIAHAVYADSLVAAERLHDAVEALIKTPSAETLAAARDAWNAARVPWGQSEPLRFNEGPVDLIESRINAWPIDENYLDYTADDPSAGLINRPDLYPVITRELLVSLNEHDGEANISAGFHAIEFLLWGQDLRADGPGARSHRDYVIGPDATAPHPERRREALRLLTAQLVADLRTLTAAWAEDDPDNYRTWFLASTPHKPLGKILHGLGVLAGAELAGERLTVAYETKEQEDEHSCFSDTTHLDVLHNALGLDNIYHGRYVRTDGTRVEGPSMHDLLLSIHPALAARLSAGFAASLEAARALPAPFDQAILGPDDAPGRRAILRTIRSLQTLPEPLAEAIQLVALPPRE